MCVFVGLMCAIIAQGAMVRDGGIEVAKTYSVEETKTYSAARERAAETNTQQAKDSDTADKSKEAGTNEERWSVPPRRTDLGAGTERPTRDGATITTRRAQDPRGAKTASER